MFSWKHVNTIGMNILNQYCIHRGSSHGLLNTFHILTSQHTFSCAAEICAPPPPPPPGLSYTYVTCYHLVTSPHPPPPPPYLPITPKQAGSTDIAPTLIPHHRLSSCNSLGKSFLAQLLHGCWVAWIKVHHQLLILCMREGMTGMKIMES